MTGLCWGFGDPRDGLLGECRGDTGPPGAKDDVNAFFEGDRGDGCPPRDPGGICKTNNHKKIKGTLR